MHYVHNKSGVASALGLSSVNQIKRYKDNAIASGLEPSRIIGGVEMFDIDILTNPQNYLEKKVTKEPALNKQSRTSIQLLFLF